MQRLLWLGVGAAAGFYAARKGSVLVEEARERGVVGNVTLAAATASRAAAATVRATAAAGELAGSRARRHADPSDSTSPVTTTTRSSREVRP